MRRAAAGGGAVLLRPLHPARGARLPHGFREHHRRPGLRPPRRAVTASHRRMLDAGLAVPRERLASRSHLDLVLNSWADGAAEQLPLLACSHATRAASRAQQDVVTRAYYTPVDFLILFFLIY